MNYRSIAGYSTFIKQTPENSLSKVIGKRIRQLRSEKGLIQNDFRINVFKSKNMMSIIEHGYVDIRIEVLDLILADMDIELVDFFNDPIFKRKPK